MANIGRKILSAFVEVTDEEKPFVSKPENLTTTSTNYAAQAGTVAGSEKFRQYFEQLFKDANLPGPDYFEFSKMTEAMLSIPDERARYSAAFAGLSVQGLDKHKLLETAIQYLQLLDSDATNFNSTVDAALKEKVHGKKQAIETSEKRIEALGREISDLQNKMTQLQQEIRENEEKIANNSGAYLHEMQLLKGRMLADVEKIKQYV